MSHSLIFSSFYMLGCHIFNTWLCHPYGCSQGWTAMVSPSLDFHPSESSIHTCTYKHQNLFQPVDIRNWWHHALLKMSIDNMSHRIFRESDTRGFSLSFPFWEKCFFCDTGDHSYPCFMRRTFIFWSCPLINDEQVRDTAKSLCPIHLQLLSTLGRFSYLWWYFFVRTWLSLAGPGCTWCRTHKNYP